jgi:iron complex outermembrane receptor protein
VQFPTNALDTKTNGLDVAANYRLHPGAGPARLHLAFNFTKNEVTRIDPLPAILVGKGSSYTSALDIVTINAIEKNRPRPPLVAHVQLFAGALPRDGRISDYGKFVDGSLDGLETFGAKQLFDGESATGGTRSTSRSVPATCSTRILTR